MVHVSQMSTGYVASPHDIVKIGDKVKVRVTEIDEQHRVNLSMLFGGDARKAPERERRELGDRPGRPFGRPRRRY